MWRSWWLFHHGFRSVSGRENSFESAERTNMPSFVGRITVPDLFPLFKPPAHQPNDASIRRTPDVENAQDLSSEQL